MFITVENAQRFVVTATAVLAGVVYFAAARGRCGQSANARYGVCVAAFAIAALVVLGLIAPAVAYAFICLSMVSVYVVDLVQDEQARRRRVASLAPRPRADSIPAIWTVVAALSAAMVTPYFLEEGNRLAASIVAACTVAMAAIAWRIASAPLLLFGDDPEAERADDRTSRARRTGLTSVLAVGIVFVFANFVNPASAETAVEHAVRGLAFFVWIGLWVWEALYVWRLDRPPAKAS